MAITRELEIMPYDKVFIKEDGVQELCHSTGYEVCFGDNVDNLSDWWNEYTDAEGNLYYGR